MVVSETDLIFALRRFAGAERGSRFLEVAREQLLKNVV